MGQTLLHDRLRGFRKVSDFCPGQALRLLDRHILFREALKGVEQMERAVGEGCVDERGEVAAEHAQFGHGAGDFLLQDLLGQQAHRRSSSNTQRQKQSGKKSRLSAGDTIWIPASVPPHLRMLLSAKQATRYSGPIRRETMAPICPAPKRTTVFIPPYSLTISSRTSGLE